MANPLPVILIELVLVFGGVLAFAWWQLRSVARDRQEAAARRSAAAPAAAPLAAETAGTEDSAAEALPQGPPPP